MRIISNTAISLDGKISTRRHEHLSLGSHLDRIKMSELRSRADAVLVGGKTFRNWPYPLIENSKYGTWKARTKPLLNVVLTHEGMHDAQLRLKDWPNEDVELVFCAHESAQFPEKIIELSAAQILRYETLSIIDAIEYIESRGCELLLLEAGGDLLFELFKLNLIDEIYLTLCPLIIGGIDTPTLSDGEGFDADSLKNFSLVSQEVCDDEIYLHYTPK
jgi:2,5-diamino-6-(ribosylamino)-4(3H)-pyrimidinone 5'-phosphate reductase